MSRPRFFLVAPWESGCLPLSEGDVRHLVTVLRAQAGDEIDVVGSDGRQSRVRLDEVLPSAVSGSSLATTEAAWTPAVVLVQAVAKNPRMDAAVEKATELGAETIVPLACDRSVVRLDKDRAAERRERWQRIAESAAKQSRRGTIPHVTDIVGVEGLGTAIADVGYLLSCDESAEAPGVGDALDTLGAASTDRIAIVVGPEGGLTDREKDVLSAMGAVPVSLGPTVLRTETAGAIATGLVAYELGGLGGRPRG